MCRSSTKFLLASLIPLIGPCAQAQSINYFQLDPPVIVPGSTTSLSVQVQVSGSPTRVTFESALQPGVETNLKDDGTGNGIYTLTLPAAPIVAAMQALDVYRPLLGYFRAYSGTTSSGRYNAFAEVADAKIPRLPVAADAADVQHTDYLVNMVAPGAFPAKASPTTIPDQAAITRRFYQLFPDTFDVINVVYIPSFFQNRFHYQVRNAVHGIGSSLIDVGSNYGSASHLLGISVFPIPTYFDGADTGVQHEFGHQWINYLNVPPVAAGIPHWPLSTMASGIMGFSITGGEGGTFACTIVPDGNGIRLNPSSGPEVFNDLDLYLMGLLPASQVAQQIVLDNQDVNSVIAQCNGNLYAGTFTRLNASDLTGNPAIGPRNPDSTSSPKQFHLATIVVTRDALLSPEAMSFYSYFAQRMELQAAVPIHQGLLYGASNPFAVSTRGLGAMIARIIPAPVPQISAVANGASFQPGLAPGAWVAVTGTTLAATTRPWNSQDFVNGVLPTMLDSVSVKIGGLAAALSYVSPTQLNVLVPAQAAPGASVPLALNAPAGTASRTVAIQAAAPGLFSADGKYAIAQHADYSLVGKAGLYPGSTPARPGETILLYGTGFGPTNPAVPGGQVISQPFPMVTMPAFRIGGQAAAVSFAGVIAAGLYQFNVTVPSGLADGDALVAATDTGATSQSGLYLTIQH